MSIAVKTCSACSQANPAFHDFCPSCGASISAADERLLPWTANVEFPPIPDSINPDVRRRLRQPVSEGRGIGMAWIGAILILIPVLFNTRSTLAYGGWVVGLLVVLTGFWQMRRDRYTLSRAGIVLNAVALLALTVIVLQIRDSDGSGGRTPSVQASVPATSTPTPDWAVASPESGATGEVAMFRGNPAHTGELPGPGITGRPYRKWRFETQGELYSSPAVVDGTLFIGSKSGFLYALDAEMGEERWRADLGDYIVRSSPAVVEGRVYIGSGPRLFALAATTGAEIWQAETQYTGASSPTIDSGMVYIASQASVVYAVETLTGKIKWQHQADGPIFSAPTVASELVIVGLDNGKLLALSQASGQVRWRFDTEGGIFSSAAVRGDLVYVTSNGGRIYAIELDTGKERWSYDAGGNTAPAVADGLVFVGSSEGGVYALDAETGGEPRWLFPTGSPIIASPAIASGLVYIVSGSTLYAVDAETGQEHWRYGAGYQIQTSPVILDGYIYIGGRDGYLDAISGDGTN